MKKFKQLINPYHLIGIVLLFLSIWNVFTGIDSADSPYHLFHYKTRIVYPLAFISGLFGVYLVSLIEILGEQHNTMIILRIINWVLIFIPFFWIIITEYSKVKRYFTVYLLFLCMALPTNWNTLCWDSWNRVYWFVIQLLCITKLYNKSLLRPLFFGLITLIGAGIKISNILTIPLFIFILSFIPSEKVTKFSITKLLLVYIGVIIFGGYLVLYNKQLLLKVFNLNEYIAEVHNASHELSQLVLSALVQVLLFLIIKLLIYIFTRKNAFETYEGMSLFVVLTIICGSFYSFHNSIIALLIIFLYFEFLFFQVKYIGWRLITILFLIPIFYAAGSDTALFKTYWIIPQTLLIYFFLIENSNSQLSFNNPNVVNLLSVAIAVLSISTLFGNELYKSSLLTNCNKTMDIIPFNNVKVSYYDKMYLRRKSEFILKNWDYNQNHTNVILGSTSFLMANAIVFKNWDTIPQNHYIFKTLHTDLNGTPTIENVSKFMKELNKGRKVSNVFYFGGLNDDAEITRVPEKFNLKYSGSEAHLYYFKYLDDRTK